MSPDIVLLLSDQHRRDAVSWHPGAICRTPALASLAAEGVVLSDGYTCCPLCSPARASLFTGLYPHRHGLLSNMGNFNSVFDRQLLGQELLFGKLRKAGYRTAYTGKWHLPEEGNGEAWGIDVWNTGHRRFLTAKGIDYDMARDEVQPLEWGADAPFAGRSVLSEHDHHDAWVADRSIETIRALSSSDDPFMLVAAFHGPHFPLAVPAPWDSLYDPADVPMWNNFLDPLDGKPVVQQKELARWNAAHLTWPDWQKVIAAYWGYCSYIDAQVGRILAALRESGRYGNAIIVYASDHGDMLGSHRLFNKGFMMYDECCRIPLVIRVPDGLPARPVPGTERRGFASLVDLLPTLEECAGLPPTAGIDGRSLLPLIEDRPGLAWRQDILVEFNGYESSLASIRMVRTSKWKYVYNPLSEDELYDLETDPGEVMNLAGKPGFRHVLRRMKERLLAQLRATRDGIVAVTPWQSASYDLFLSDRER